MITRVARNDVVRLVQTGEVGMVKGWADHENLAQHGTVVDVEVARGKCVQANGNGLEFVADARPELSRTKAVWVILAVLLSLASGSYTAWYLVHLYGLPVLGAMGLGVGEFMLMYRAAYVLTIRPRKTRLTLPARTTIDRGQRAQSRPVGR